MISRFSSSVLTASFLILLGTNFYAQESDPSASDTPTAITEEEKASKSPVSVSYARIDSVLLYSDLVYVTRQSEVKLPAGVSEVLLGEVPIASLDKSVIVTFTDPNKKFKIKGIRVSEKASRRKKSQEAEELEKRKEGLLLALSTKSREVQDLLDWEASIKSIKPAIREQDGVVEKIDSENFSSFRKTYAELAEDNTKLRLAKLEELDRIREEFYIVTTKISHLAEGDTLRRKEIRLDVESDSANVFPFEYKYLIRGANWYPRYTLELNSNGQEAELGWHALVRNETGEDWKNVRLEFSTANPNQDIDLPEYREYRIASKEVAVYSGDEDYSPADKEYDAPSKPSANAGAMIQSKKESKKKAPSPKVSQRSKAEERVDDVQYQEKNDNPLMQSRALIEGNYKDRSNSIRVEENMNRLQGELANQKYSFDQGSYEESIRYGKEALRRFSGLRESSRKELKELENEVQNLLNRSSQLSSDKKYSNQLIAPGISSEGFDFRYIAQSREKIPSDRTLNRVFLRKRNITVRPGYETSPLTNDGVFLNVVSSNTEREPLLAGPLEIYSGENLLGTTTVSTLKPGQEIKMELGPDRDIKVERKQEKLDDKSGIISRKKNIRYRVTISIKNNKRRAVPVRLIDRIPYTNDDSVKVEWSAGTDTPKSKTEDGILTYEFEIGANSRKTIQFEYTVSYPADNILRETPGSDSY
ncbi:mucoidy inhibitor MuiA family protein [Leptospira andrefontaineae]|uniref:Mucoidy inhibitor MuiA family protein n=1 Tax=Leptospira andrefontaineae TaxID=2484976 RepID=A0A4R9H0S9_9LEPT|nr:mucoidy inhibitor MuiA family protein [Leptospira andrefontaineae]TGK37913.1 mucoidy inhibitor MuiA family protein [Leptospira andrefontaineae]